MAIQTAIKTVHGRGVANFERDLNGPGHGEHWSIEGWAAALESFDLSFTPGVSGGHNVRAMAACVDAVHFAAPHALTAPAVTALINDQGDDALTKMSIFAMTSDTSDANTLYLFSQPPVVAGNAVTHTFPGAVSMGIAGLGGFRVTYPLSETSDHHVRTVSAVLSNNVITSGTQITPTISVSIQDNSGHSGSGSAAIVYAGVPSGSNIPSPQKATWNPSYGTTTAVFTNLATRGHAQAFVILTDFTISYGSSTDHQVKQISVSAGNDTVLIDWSQGTSGWTATVSFMPAMVLHDDSGNVVSATSSSLNAYVFLIPAVSQESAS